MRLFVTRPDWDIAKIDTETVAFNVMEHQVEDVVSMLVVAIGARCMMEYGVPPEILE